MLTLSWVTEATVQLPEGGDGVSQVFEELRLDVLETDSHDGVTTYTEHSVESGTPVTDHAEPQLERYSATVWVSERPARLDLVEGSFRAATPPAQASLITTPDGTARAVDTLEQLNTLRRNATLVSVDGARAPIEEWVIEAVSAPRSVADAGALVANVVFREWRVVELEDTEAPSPTIERGRRQANRGTQSTEQTSDETPSAEPAEREDSASVLRQALGGGGEAFDRVQSFLTGGTS